MLHHLLDLLFPRHCVVCGKRLEPDEDAICLMCNAMLPRLDYFDHPYDNPLARMFFGKVEVERVAAFIKFEPHTDVARLIYTKYFGNSEACRAVGRLLAFEAQDKGFFDGIDIIVPVPITAGREFDRGFNQSNYIAKGISEVTHIPMTTKALARILFRKSQTSLTYTERQENVKDAFLIVSGKEIEGKHVLLVDDVITTGATTTACAEKILSVKGTRLSILSVGKTTH